MANKKGGLGRGIGALIPTPEAGAARGHRWRQRRVRQPSRQDGSRGRVPVAAAAADDRIIRSLDDSIATATAT